MEWSMRAQGCFYMTIKIYITSTKTNIIDCHAKFELEQQPFIGITIFTTKT